MNLLLGLITVALLRSGPRSRFVRFFAILNLLIPVVVWAPLPTMDGGVFLREFRVWRGGRRR